MLFFFFLIFQTILQLTIKNVWLIVLLRILIERMEGCTYVCGAGVTSRRGCGGEGKYVHVL